MIREVSESFAGRVGIIELDPLTVVEISTGTPRLAWEEMWLSGGSLTPRKGHSGHGESPIFGPILNGISRISESARNLDF